MCFQNLIKRELSAWKLENSQLSVSCVMPLQHMPFCTTAEWEHGVATCLTFKNWRLGLHFQVLLWVSKMGLLAIAYWREQTAKERLLTRTKMCQKFQIDHMLTTLKGSGTCIVTLYIGGFAVLFGVLSVPISCRKQDNQFSMSFLPFLRQL